MVRSILAAAAAATCAGLFQAPAQAQTWNQTGGTHNWNDPANWDGGVVPNGVGAVANLTNGLTSDQVILISEADYVLTLGELSIGNPVFSNPYLRYSTIGSNRPVRFDNGEEPARINAVANVGGLDVAFNQHDILSTGFGIFLDSDLIIDATHPTGAVNPDMLRIRADIVNGANGPKGLTKTGDGWVELWPFGGNNFTGLTQVMGGRLRIGAGSNTTVIAGDIEISGGAILQMSFGFSEHIADTSIVRFVGPGQFNPGGGSETIGGLEAVGEETHSAFAGGGAGTITFGGNNLDATFEGFFSSSTSIEKVGTGVQTLGGTQPSVTDSGSSIETNAFSVLGGRVHLAKTDGLASIANRNLIIGDGGQSGADRPEVRLLANEQINVTVGAVAEETTRVELNAGILNLNGHTETVGSVVSVGFEPGTIDLGAGGTFNVVGNFTVDNFAKAEVRSSSAGTVTVGGLVMANGGQNRWLDLTTNRLVVQNGDVAEITGLVQRGYASGAWTGDGISSSAAAAESGRALGIGQAGDDVTVAFTWGGDASLDGSVTIADLGILAANWQGTDRNWFHGDFNYDGSVTIADLGILAANWQRGVSGGSSMSFAEAMAMFDVFTGVVVPEPASVSMLLGLGLLGMRRRRSC